MMRSLVKISNYRVILIKISSIFLNAIHRAIPFPKEPPFRILKTQPELESFLPVNTAV
jgi:hypothetical protein